MSSKLQEHHLIPAQFKAKADLAQVLGISNIRRGEDNRKGSDQVTEEKSKEEMQKVNEATKLLGRILREAREHKKKLIF